MASNLDTTPDGIAGADDRPRRAVIASLRRQLDGLFLDTPDVFVAGGLPWYPVEGNAEIRFVPDVMVVFGRPRGHRDGYRPWDEGGVAPHVLFEVRARRGRFDESLKKARLYERFGIEEAYIFGAEDASKEGWVRTSVGLKTIHFLNRWVSPRLGVWFDLGRGCLNLGTPPPTLFELQEQCEAIEREADEARRRVDRLAARLRELGEDCD